MTWIVAVPIPFGYAKGCADIRVTFKNGREEDCLQKIYQVGPVVCAAFAGSVRIGFALPSRTAQTRMPNLEQQLKSEFMLFGAHPNQGSSWPKPCVYTFRSPQFDAVPATGPLEACSLGKGELARLDCLQLF